MNKKYQQTNIQKLFSVNNMDKNYQVLKKRKISSGIVIENKKKTKNYIVWDEHNYCNVLGKKRSKKIVRENDTNIIKINDIDDVYNDMPSYLKHYKSLSDEEENSPVDVDIPLAKLLQIEYKKDLAREVRFDKIKFRCTSII